MASSNALRRLVADCRKRAKVKGLEFDLPDDFIEKLYRRQKGRCSLTDIEFDFDKKDSANRRPFAPSVDRRNRTKGYVKGNVRLVCIAVNMALFTWGDSVFDKVCRSRVEVVKNGRGGKNINKFELDSEMSVSRRQAESYFGLASGWFSGRQLSGLLIPKPHKILRENLKHPWYRYKIESLEEFFSENPETLTWKPPQISLPMKEDAEPEKPTLRQEKPYFLKMTIIANQGL